MLRSAPYSQETNPVLPMDKTMSQVATITSSVWNTPAASLPPNGVLPPSPTTLLQPRPYNSTRREAPYDLQSTRREAPYDLQSTRREAPYDLQSTRREAPYQLWRIQSNREPYASEFMVTPYGGMESKLGTNLGR
jgi:hypothetical protein